MLTKEEMNDMLTKDSDHADNEGKELNDAGEVESAGDESVTAPPPYSDLSELFGPLEDVAQSAGNSEAGYYLCKAKMSFLAAHAAKPTRQADIRAFVES